jgi:hypothetical protein
MDPADVVISPLDAHPGTEMADVAHAVFLAQDDSPESELRSAEAGFNRFQMKNPRVCGVADTAGSIGVPHLPAESETAPSLCVAGDLCDVS